MKYDSILFDLDGTLTDSSEGITKCAALALDHYGIPYQSLSDLRVFIGPPLRETFPKFGVPQEEVENAIAVFRSRYTTVGKFENRPYDGIEDLLTALREAGCHLYVATSKPEKTAREILGKFALDRYFDEIAGASADASRDSKEQVIAYLFSKCSVNGRTLMVGDTAYDMKGAAALGIDSVGVSWGFGSEESMLSAGAKTIVRTPDELFTFVSEK